MLATLPNYFYRLLYNFQRFSKSLKFKTPYEIIIEWYEKDKNLFKINPRQKLLGLNKLLL